MGEIEYVDAPLEFDIRRETVIVRWSSGARQAIPLDVFRENCRRAADALSLHDHGNIFEFPRPKRPRKPKGDAAGG